MSRLLTLGLLICLTGCTPATFSAWFDSTFVDFRLLPLMTSPRQAQENIALALDNKEYLHAFELLLQEKRRGRPEKIFGAALPRAFNGLIDQAEQQFLAQEYTTAGLLFQRLEQNLPLAPELRKDISLDRNRLRERLNACADRLLEKGLRAYRTGNFKQALAIWQEINRFYPAHKASQQAIRTTRTQLENLSALPSDT